MPAHSLIVFLNLVYHRTVVPAIESDPWKRILRLSYLYCLHFAHVSVFSAKALLAIWLYMLRVGNQFHLRYKCAQQVSGTQHLGFQSTHWKHKAHWNTQSEVRSNAQGCWSMTNLCIGCASRREFSDRFQTEFRELTRSWLPRVRKNYINSILSV